MARRVAVAVAGLLVAGSEALSCDSEAKALRQQLDTATKELDALRAARPSFSVLGAVSGAGQLVGEATQQFLDSTDVDETVITALSGMSADVYSTVANVNYADYVKTARGHYDVHLAGHVDKVSKTLKPHMDQYVYPAIDQASAQVTPVLAQAKGHYAAAAKSLETQVLPTLQGHISEAPKHLEKAQSVANNLLDPLFDTAAKAAPKHRDLLPKHPVDRVLLLVVFAFVGFNLFFVGRRFARFGFSLSWGSFKITWAVFWGLTSRVVSWAFFFGTGFYCCCLCRRRGGAKKLKAKASKANGANNATVKEVVAMLETFKKDKKLAPAAKQLVELAKTGKTMNTPKEMSGKVVNRDTVKQALSKFKEVNLKTLGL